jgi:circadian clock protein KaiC
VSWSNDPGGPRTRGAPSGSRELSSSSGRSANSGASAGAPPLTRLTTGMPALDQILGGGIPTRSVVVIAGEPGAGKTVCTLRMVFHRASLGEKCLYFTTLAEPALKLVRYAQQFSFFDQTLVDEHIVFTDLGNAIRERGAEGALTEVAARVEREEPQLVVIDSFKSIHDLLGEKTRSRAFVYDLAVQLAAWGTTSLLVGEYSEEDVSREPEFAIADGIIRLSNQPQELTAMRVLEVTKLRGAQYISGRHFFELGEDGATFYPRVRAPDDEGEAVPISERLEFGVSGLDELLDGGVPRTSATIVEGGTGTGKTLLGLHFLMAGARRGEPCVLFTLEETAGQLREIARGFGWDLAALEAAGLLVIEYTSPVELSTDRFLNRARQRVAELGARRAVLDSLSSTAMGVASERRFRELVYALTKHFRAAGVTLLLTTEVAEVMGTAQLTGRGVSSIADNVVLLRYVEIDGELRRAISVIKARGVHHLADVRQMKIGSQGATVDGHFRGLRAVLTGVPVGNLLVDDTAGATVGARE